MTKLPITGQLAISGNYLINRYFDDARRQIATLLEAVELDISKPIKWSDLPPEKRRAVAQIYQQVLAQMTAVVGSATSRAWIAQTEQSKALSILDKEERRQLTEENLRKLSAFRSRKVGGLSLSGRIWQYVKQEQDSIELVLQRVIAEQNNSGDAYKLFAKYLDAPEEMIRYIQKQGKPDETAKAFAQFHRGTGVYRDPVKNILRMMRTEVNRATKTADWQLMQSNPYVVGYEIKRSSREHKYKDKCEVCKRLVGVYPKTFHFVGWHPQCECACTPIYASREEQRQIRRQLKAGKKPEEIRSQEAPRGLPTAFVSVMAQYQTEGRALPFAMSEALSTYKPSALDSSRLRQTKRTPEERQAIQERWDKRNTIRKKEAEELRLAKEYDVYRDFSNQGGGQVKISKLLSREDKAKADYQQMKRVAEFMARQGAEVTILPRIHYKSPAYREIYGALIGTDYERKCPDLLIDGKFYEFESYVRPWGKRRLVE